MTDQFDSLTEMSYLAYCKVRERKENPLKASELETLFPDRAREFEQRYLRERIGWRDKEASYLRGLGGEL